MSKNLGILSVFVVVFLLTAGLSESGFLSAGNLQNLVQRASGYAILGIAMMFVIVTGGIDLSVGSLICLNACVLQWLLIQQGVPPVTGLLIILLLSVVIGLCHGLLVTKVSLQPFVVTLCGLLLYRGLARWMTGDQNVGWGGDIPELRKVATGGIPFGDTFVLPWPFVVMMVIAIVAAMFLHKTIYGRYLLALGRNEQAARYSGIDTNRMVIVAYVLCSVISAIGGTIMALYQSLIQPTAIGTFFELYAIAACVLGRCSLRGGQGYVFGVIMGAALLPLIRNSISFLGIGDQLEFGVIGIVILIGVIFDEIVRALAVMRREGLSVWEWATQIVTSSDNWNRAGRIAQVVSVILIVLAVIGVSDSALSLSSAETKRGSAVVSFTDAMKTYNEKAGRPAPTDLAMAESAFKSADRELKEDVRAFRKQQTELNTSQRAIRDNRDLTEAERQTAQAALNKTSQELTSQSVKLKALLKGIDDLKPVFDDWKKSVERYEFKTACHANIKQFVIWICVVCVILFVVGLGIRFLIKSKADKSVAVN